MDGMPSKHLPLRRCGSGEAIFWEEEKIVFFSQKYFLGQLEHLGQESSSSANMCSSKVANCWHNCSFETLAKLQLLGYVTIFYTDLDRNSASESRPNLSLKILIKIQLQKFDLILANIALIR